MSEPQVLLVTSVGSSASAVTPVLAALEAHDLRVRAIDVGRVGSRKEGTVDRVFRALVGELSERRLVKELESNPPDVVVAFDPGATQALTVARDAAKRAAPVVAIVDELVPDKAWSATDADRYLVVDDQAAVALADVGVEGERILPVGPFCGHAYARAARESRAAIRSRYKLGGGPVVVVVVAGLGYETTSQIALQLSLAKAAPLYLFDAGEDRDAATALRSQVPALDMRAKLFGATSDAAYYWRAADVVVARPSADAIARALIVGARVVSFSPEDAGATTRARAIEERKIGAQATNPLLLSSALEPLLGRGAADGETTAADGAGNAADIVWIVGTERVAVIDERLSVARAETHAKVRAATSAAEAAARVAAPAGGLEDLSGGAVGFDASAEAPDLAELSQLKAELSTRMSQVSKTVFAAREAAERWEGQATKAEHKGDAALAADAKRNAETERARMHQALGEMAQLQSEQKALERAEAQARMAAARPRPSASAPSPDAAPQASPRRPAYSVDDELERLKKQSNVAGGTSASAPPPKKKRKKVKKSSVDHELEALKRKMAEGKKP